MPSAPRFNLSVLMTADAVGGVWTYAIGLAARLAERGVQVSLATMGARPTIEQRHEAEAVPGLCLFESDYRLEWMDDPWDDVQRAGDWLLDLERRLAPDVVHLNGYCHAALPWRQPVLVVGHSCVLSWWEAVKREPLPPRYRRYWEEVGRGIRAAARLVAPTHAMRTALERHYGPHPRARVIPNGHDPTSFVFASKEPIVFCAARVWDEAKNVAALAEAAPKLRVPVFVAGDTAAPAGASAIGLSHVTLLGRLARADVLRWLTRSSIFALPARYEPFGLAALEAACAGCALVLGDIPSQREIWGEDAVLVPPGDPDALGRAINVLAKDGRRRMRLAARARTRGLRLSAARMADQYSGMYIEMARARTGAAWEAARSLRERTA